MQQERKFLAFDCGATSGRALMGTFNDNALDFTMEEVYRFPNQTVEVEGRYYWDVDYIYGHILQCLSDMGRRQVRIDSIGIDTWGVDFGCIGDDGGVLGMPRAYRDPYTVGVPQKFFDVVPHDELYALTGIQTMDFNTVFQLYAQKEEGCEALRSAKHLLFMPDLLTCLLTGKVVCEYTVASTSGLMDQHTHRLVPSLLQALNLDEQLFPPVSQPGMVVGTLRADIALTSGLGPVPVVSVAGHDTASAIIAVPTETEHFAYLSSGTWSLMGIEVHKPIIDEKSARLNFTNEGGIEGTTRFLKNITGMWLVEQCRKAWKRQGREYTYNEITTLALSAAAYQGRINPDNPRFANPADMDDEIRHDLAEKGFPPPANDAEVLSCIYHSLAERYKEVLDMLQEMAPFAIERLHIIGGGAANELLNQWTVDAIGMPVVAGPSEATAIGNLMMQAKAAGLVKDRWEMRRMITETVTMRRYVPTKTNKQ